MNIHSIKVGIEPFTKERLTMEEATEIIPFFNDLIYVLTLNNRRDTGTTKANILNIQKLAYKITDTEIIIFISLGTEDYIALVLTMLLEEHHEGLIEILVVA